MKIAIKLILGFLTVALLVLFVGLFGLDASKQIASFYGGLSEEFAKDVNAAIEASSYAKRAEGHLMLYLTLDTQIDKEKFFARHKSLEEQIEILDIGTKSLQEQQQLEKLKSASNDILRIGNKLIEAHDKNPEDFDPKDYADLVVSLNEAASKGREAGVEIAKQESVITGESVKSATEKSKSIQRSVIILMVATVIISLGIGFFTAYHISNPIRKLKEAADEVGKGNLDVEVKIKTKDELSVLADTFNSMLVSIKNLRHVKEIQKLEKELVALEQAYKSKFISEESYTRDRIRLVEKLQILKGQKV